MSGTTKKTGLNGSGSSSLESQNSISDIYMKDIKRYAVLTKDKELELAYKAKQGDRSAYNAIINANLRLVVKLARDYLNRGVPFMDLVAEGNMGLMHALDKFDPDRGFRFSTYAGWWVRQHIERAIMNQSRIVRLPPHVIKEMNKMSRTSQELSARFEQEISHKQLAEHMETDHENVRQMMSLMPSARSLDTPLQSGTHTTHGDMLSGEEHYTPHHMATHDHNQDIISQWLEQFTEEERDVLVLRYGLFGSQAHTLEQIASQLNMAREKVRQIQLRCTKRLKIIAQRDGISDYFDIAA